MKNFKRKWKYIERLEEKQYWIWLSLIKGAGSITKQKLLKKYQTPKKIYELDKSELASNKWLPAKVIANILDVGLKKQVYEHIRYMCKNGIDIVSINDEDYPQLLKNIYDFPISLYVKGNKKILNNQSISIIGCRNATTYGKKAAKYFAYHLAKNEITVVSGLARGIDSYAHIGALSGQCESKSKEGKTIAVLGNGLDTVYPAENVELYRKIVEFGGLIVSEYPLGVGPEKMNFPARNRIISGLCKKILVIEAKEKSGTMLTVDFALEQGKEIFAMPGNINSSNSVGTNHLIKCGAQIATTYKDLLLDI